MFIHTFIYYFGRLLVLISLKCACLAVWNVHAFCLKQEYVLGRVMLPNSGPLRDQYVFIVVTFLCVRFSIFS